MRVAIVGGGAAGVLTAAHLRRVRPDAQITLIDSSGRPGTGAAYGTGDPVHLLNVPAHRMSAWPDDPDHFCRWLNDHAVTAPEGFAPGSPSPATCRTNSPPPTSGSRPPRSSAWCPVRRRR